MAQRIFRSDDTSTWVDKFGDGSDGAETITSTQNDSAVKTGCSGTEGNSHVSVSSGQESNFTVGRLCLIIQTRGSLTSGVNYEFNKISGNSTSGRIDLEYELTKTFSNTGDDQAQIIEIHQYTTFEIESGNTLNMDLWDQDTGGVLVRFASESIVIDGSINGDGDGYKGGTRGDGQGNNDNVENWGFKGEGRTAASFRTKSTTRNVSGGGGGTQAYGGNYGGGGGGGHGTAGGNGDNAGVGGVAAGNSELTILVLGGGGGGGGSDWPSEHAGGVGGDGGGVVILAAPSISGSGSISVDGANGSNGLSSGGGGGGGAGGALLVKGRDVDFSSLSFTATGGSGGANTGSGSSGNGGVGRGNVDYLNSYSSPSSQSPTINSRVESALAAPGGGVGRFYFM